MAAERSGISTGDAAGMRFGLNQGEQVAGASALVLLFAMIALPWFVLAPDGIPVAGGSGNAFDWLGDVDILLVAAALIAIALPLLRASGVIELSSPALELTVFAAGIVAFVLIGDRIISPPGLADDAFGHFGGGEGDGADARIGVWVGLFASAGIAAGALAGLPWPITPSKTASTTTSKPARAPRIERTPRPTAPPAQPPPRPAAARPARFSSITVEELQGIGLSLTQAKRVIRYRDELGLVSGAGDLDRVPGIQAALREKLRSALADG